jgi:hypothetical protein
MSALGQKQTFAPQKVMSALPPKADITWRIQELRKREAEAILAQDREFRKTRYHPHRTFSVRTGEMQK